MIKETLNLFFGPLRNRYVIVAIVIITAVLLFTKNTEAESLIFPYGTYEDFEPQIVLVSHEIPPIIHTVPQSAEELSRTNLYIEDSHPIEYCIALNVYYEARADNLAGKYAVADVVLNRVQDARFPNTACEVIREGIMLESWSTAQHPELPDEERKYYPKRDRCQFSWYCDGMADVPTDRESWRDAQIIAYNIVQFGTFRGITEGATHYHATYVSPSWSLIYHVVGRIGAHIFYRWV